MISKMTLWAVDRLTLHIPAYNKSRDLYCEQMQGGNR